MTHEVLSATYVVSDRVVDQIRLSLEYLWGLPPEIIPEDNDSLVQFWVEMVLDSTMDDEHAVLIDMDEVDHG
jgi:hypothetical protein